MTKDRAIEDCADWPFIRHGAISVFRKQSVLDDAIAAVGSQGYRVARIDCSAETTLIRDIAGALHWEEWFGYLPDHLNLDAFNDALRNEPNSARPRLVLVLMGFVGFRKDDEKRADAVLDIIEYQARDHLLHDERLVAFVHSEDPTFHVEDLGGRQTHWNEKEWLMSARGE